MIQVIAIHTHKFTRFTRIPLALARIDEEFLLDVFDKNDLLELLLEYWQESIQAFLTA